MWYVNALVAIDIARERAREAEAASERHRLAQLVAVQRRAHPQRFVGRRRVVVAAALRRLSTGADSLATAACNAASRVDGRTA